MIQLDPISLMSIAMIHIGSRHLSLNLTEYQKKMLQHPITQAAILFALVYASTKDIKMSIIVMIMIYASLYVLLNDEHELSIITKDAFDIRRNYYSHLQDE